MSGQLIYECPEEISFSLDEDNKIKKIESFIITVYNHYHNTLLGEFLDILKIDDFFNNLTSREYYIDDIIIPKDYKVVKAFKYFEQDENILKLLQSEASRIIQENVITGTLCLSVHPLDYLSVSENPFNWRSCHALDGDYRSGNLNYLVDENTVVCYLRSNKQSILPHFPETVLWNSKKWRVLLFFTDDANMVFAGRPYPFVADTGLEVIRNKILIPCFHTEWSKWCNSYLSLFKDKVSNREFYFHRLIPVGNELREIKNIIKNRQFTYHFNDLLNSSCYSPWWSYKEDDLLQFLHCPTGMTTDSTVLHVGDACPCPICGENNVSFSDLMVCADCANKYHYYYDKDDHFECEICGQMTLIDDEYFLEISQLHVCPHCYETETVECHDCKVRDLGEYIYYKNHSRYCLCEHCWEQNEKKQINEIEIMI